MNIYVQGDLPNLYTWNNFWIMRLMKNCLVQKLCGFKEGV